MTKILNTVLTRIEVADLAAALPAYQTIAGTDEVTRHKFPEFAMAIVGPFMLLEGTPDVLAKYSRIATLLVTDVQDAVDAFVKAGGTLVDGPTDTGSGLRAFVQDRDGNVFEAFRPKG